MALENITIPINESTKRKLLALAMLEGKKVSDIEEYLAMVLEGVIQDRCLELLGAQREESVVVPARPFTPQVNKLAEAEQAANSEIEEAFADIEVEDPVSGHELSGDEDLGDNKSLAEQVEEESTDDDDDEAFSEILRDNRRFAEAKSDDDFVDGAMGPKKSNVEIPSASRQQAFFGEEALFGERPRRASGKFQAPRVKVGYATDEN